MPMATDGNGKDFRSGIHQNSHTRTLDQWKSSDPSYDAHHGMPDDPALRRRLTTWTRSLAVNRRPSPTTGADRFGRFGKTTGFPFEVQTNDFDLLAVASINLPSSVVGDVFGVDWITSVVVRMASTMIVSLPTKAPRSNSSLNGSSMRCSIARRSGRAP